MFSLKGPLVGCAAPIKVMSGQALGVDGSNWECTPRTRASLL
jgi:hypothetical protein